MKESAASQRTEELFHAFFDGAPIGAAISAPDGSWLCVNAALVALLGYSAEELQATTLLALTHADDLAATHEVRRALLAGERESCDLEKRFRAKDGHTVWVSATTRVHRDAQGGALHFLAYVRDVTERKSADAELRASELRYRRLFESAKDGILILDAATGRVVDVNPFMAELTGYATLDFVGKHLWEIGPFADVAASKVSFAELLTNDYVRYEDLPLKTPDGREVEVEFVSNVYLVDGKRVIQCNIRDITVRKRAEAELRMLERAIQAVSQGIVITDARRPDNPIVYASPGFTRMTGYTQEESVERNPRFLQRPDTDRGQLAILRQALHQEQASTVELLNARKDGSAYWSNLAISPVRDDMGRLSHFIGVMTDVTERRKLEAQFGQAQKMEAVGRLAGGVAHDFNNLLSVILSYAEMTLASLRPGEPIAADIGEIREAALRASGLTKQLLAFSRQQVVEPRVLDVNEILAGMEGMLARLLGADIAVTVLPKRGLGHVKADRGQIEQMVMNLAVNARDAMLKGGNLTLETDDVELDAEYARTHLDVAAGPYVLIAVSDSGTGIDKATMARLFEPFFTTKDKGKGTGLGLATVFGIVKQSGGHVFVYSEPGKGSTFKVYLPRVSAPVQERLSKELAPMPEHVSGTILLVEDEEQVRILARTILRRQGYVVLDASNGGEALLVCEQHGATIDLLLTDVVLPRMSGRQLAERLAPSRPEMKVLYMSGYTDDAILQHGILNSGVAFLQKPLTPTALLRRVGEVLRGDG